MTSMPSVLIRLAVSLAPATPAIRAMVLHAMTLMNVLPVVITVILEPPALIQWVVLVVLVPLDTKETELLVLTLTSVRRMLMTVI